MSAEITRGFDILDGKKKIGDGVEWGGTVSIRVTDPHPALDKRFMMCALADAAEARVELAREGYDDVEFCPTDLAAGEPLDPEMTVEELADLKGGAMRELPQGVLIVNCRTVIKLANMAARTFQSEYALRTSDAVNNDIREQVASALEVEGHRMWLDDIIPRAHSVMRQLGESIAKSERLERGLAEQHAREGHR